MSDLRLRLRLPRHAGTLRRWPSCLVVLLLLGLGSARADDVQLPQHVVLNQSFGLVMGDDILNGLVMAGLKAARLPFGQWGPGSASTPWSSPATAPTSIPTTWTSPRSAPCPRASGHSSATAPAAPIR